MFWNWYPSSYRSSTGCGSSSTPGFSRSSSVASASLRHSASSLEIWAPVICRARLRSFSDGTFTSHGRKARSSMSGSHWDRSQSALPFSDGRFRHGSRHSSTTTLSALAGMKPSRNALREPQL